MRRIVVIVTLVSILILQAACSEEKKHGEGGAERVPVTGVVVARAEVADVFEYYETSGTIRAKNTSLVSAKIMGEVMDVKVKAADRVQRGDILLEIDAPHSEAGVSAAREALAEAREGLRIAGEEKALAEKTFERYRKLYEEQAITGQEFDEVSARKAVADAGFEKAQRTVARSGAHLNEAEALRGYRVIRSPIDGVVAVKKIDKGSMTLPGMELFVIEELAYRVEASVDERLIHSVDIGTEVIVEIASLDFRSSGRVAEIVRQIDPGTRTFTVKIDLPESGGLLRGGLYAAVQFPVGTRQALRVSEEALVQRGELEAVYVVHEEGAVSLRLVRAGKRSGGMVEILSGLTGGERVITKGTDTVVDGGRIANEQ